MAATTEDSLRIVEISNAFEQKKRYDLQQFKQPEKAYPEDEDGTPIWIRLASFSSLEEAKSALLFIQENKSVEVVSIIQ
ncbi:MAG TPA: hypothetical protein ENK28_08785 [Aliiroseovarius sp.]|nr:hypothetical protein [Aliiroseovarius sp.]